MRLAVAMLLVLVAGCDVEASLGAHDSGADGSAPNDGAMPVDGAIPIDGFIPIDGPVAMCTPPDAGACIACEAAMCCEPFMACAMAATCPCIVDCVLSGHAIDSCVTHCGGPDHGEHEALLTCAEGHCPASCP